MHYNFFELFIYVDDIYKLNRLPVEMSGYSSEDEDLVQATIDDLLIQSQQKIVKDNFEVYVYVS